MIAKHFTLHTSNRGLEAVYFENSQRKMVLSNMMCTRKQNQSERQDQQSAVSLFRQQWQCFVLRVSICAFLRDAYSRHWPKEVYTKISCRSLDAPIKENNLIRGSKILHGLAPYVRPNDYLMMHLSRPAAFNYREKTDLISISLNFTKRSLVLEGKLDAERPELCTWIFAMLAFASGEDVASRRKDRNQETWCVRCRQALVGCGKIVPDGKACILVKKRKVFGGRDYHWEESLESRRGWPKDWKEYVL